MRHFCRCFEFVVEKTSNNANEIVPDVQMRWTVEDLEVVWLIVTRLHKLITNVSERRNKRLR